MTYPITDDNLAEIARLMRKYRIESSVSSRIMYNAGIERGRRIGIEEAAKKCRELAARELDSTRSQEYATGCDDCADEIMELLKEG